MAGGWVKSLHCKSTALDDVVRRRRHATCRDSADVIKSIRPKPPPPPPPAPRASSGPARVPALTELAAGHPSRNVVEIIFRTSWAGKGFAGRVEMIFKVRNGPRTLARFEEYRDTVKSRAGSGRPGDNPEENARCAADGNEVMRFHCLGGGAWSYDGAWDCKEAAICTFSGGGEAHEGCGGGRGRKGMLVCRVVAGRVGFDSVSGDDGGLMVFDSRAVLPCFLIIYRM